MNWQEFLTLNMKAFFFVWFLLLLVAVTSQSNKHVKYKTITMQKVISLGNYESQRLEITAEVNTDCEDELNDCLLELNASITDALNQFKQQHEYIKAREAEEAEKLKELPW